MPTPTTGRLPFSSAFDQGRYGLASRFDFDNPSKWVSVPDVPLLDEHEITGTDGKPEAIVDRNVLEEIAANNNRRVFETGDPATLILGHTSDDPRAPEKPSKGFAVNYRVKPFKRSDDGRLVYAIHADIKVRPQNAHILEEYPRRSVELWLSKREIDPIALLGGTTPERDLSVLIRKSRLTAIGLAHEPKTALEKREAAKEASEAVLKYRARYGTLYRYAMEGCMPKHIDAEPGQYGDDEFEGETDDLGGEGGDNESGGSEPDDGGDPPFGGEDGGPDGGEDPVVAKVLASKAFRALEDKVNQIFDAVTGGEGAAGGAPPGGAGGMDNGMGMEGAGTGVGAMPPGGTGAPSPTGGASGGLGGPGGMGGSPDEEAAMFHGQKPVRFDEGMGGDDGLDYSASGFAGPASTSVPGTGGGRGRPFSRNGHSNNGNGKGKPNMNGTKTRQTPLPAQQNGQLAEQVRRLSRSNSELVLKLARADCREILNRLEQEGIVFGDTPEESEREKAKKVEFLARIGEQDRGLFVEDMRRNYRRRESDPANPGGVLPARYGRAEFDGRGEAPPANDDPNDFVPANPQEAMAFAEACHKFGATPEGHQKAVQYMRNRGKKAPAGRR